MAGEPRATDPAGTQQPRPPSLCRILPQKINAGEALSSSPVWTDASHKRVRLCEKRRKTRRRRKNSRPESSGTVQISRSSLRRNTLTGCRGADATLVFSSGAKLVLLKTFEKNAPGSRNERTPRCSGGPRGAAPSRFPKSAVGPAGESRNERKTRVWKDFYNIVLQQKKR